MSDFKCNYFKLFCCYFILNLIKEIVMNLKIKYKYKNKKQLKNFPEHVNVRVLFVYFYFCALIKYKLKG